MNERPQSSVGQDDEDHVEAAHRPLLGALTEYSCVHMRLAHAIADKDPRAVAKALEEKPALTGKFLKSTWSERVIASFHPEVANLMVKAGMRCLLPQSLFHIACTNDDVAAYEWLFQDKEVKVFLDSPKRRKYDVGETNRDVMRFKPWQSRHGGVRLRRHLLEHSELAHLLPQVITHAYHSFKELATLGDWQEVTRMMKVMATVPAQPSKNGHQEDIPLRTLFRIHQGCASHHGFFKFDEVLAASPEGRSVLSLLLPMDVSIEYNARRWLDSQERSGLDGDRRVKADTLSQSLYIACPPALLDVIRTPKGLDGLVEVMQDPVRGQVLLANMAHRFKTSQIQEVLHLLLPRIEGWRDPSGRNAAHVLLSAGPTVALSEYLSRHFPALLTEGVPGLGSGLDSMADSTSRLGSRAPAAARIRNNILRKEARAARAQKNDGVPVSRSTPTPKRAM